MAEKFKNLPRLSDDKRFLDLAFQLDTTYLYQFKVKLKENITLLPDMLSNVKASEVKPNLLNKCTIPLNQSHPACLLPKLLWRIS
jgi:hypothetical protein